MEGTYLYNKFSLMSFEVSSALLGELFLSCRQHIYGKVHGKDIFGTHLTYIDTILSEGLLRDQ